MFERYVMVAVGATLAAWGCSSSPGAPTPPAAPSAPGSAPPAGPPTVTISATGFSPLEITVPVAGRVTFVNTDRIGHDIAGGFEHNSPECPEVTVIGFLVPGQSRETAPFDQAMTCRFHDHSNVGNSAYQGRIVVR